MSVSKPDFLDLLLLSENGDKIIIFHSIERENFAAAWDIKPKIIRILGKFT